MDLTDISLYLCPSPYAVGSKGKVLSVEVRDDHHRRAALNYKRWRTSWSLRRGEDWPDNVQFLKADLQTAGPLLTGWGFNSVRTAPPQCKLVPTYYLCCLIQLYLCVKSVRSCPQCMFECVCVVYYLHIAEIKFCL